MHTVITCSQQPSRASNPEPNIHFCAPLCFPPFLLHTHPQISLARYLSGSQLAVWYYRALGANIGSGVLLNGLHRWGAELSVLLCIDKQQS